MHFGGAGLRPVFAQGQDLTLFRRCRLCSGPLGRASSQCPGRCHLLSPLPIAGTGPACSIPILGLVGTRGDRAVHGLGEPSAGLARAARAPAAGMCWSTQRLRAPLQGSFLQVSRVEQSQGIEAFLTLSILALWEQNKRGFGMSNADVYLHMHTIGRVLTSAE